MSYTIQSIVPILDAKWLFRSGEGLAQIEHIHLDSRATPPPNALFFALKGQRHDGHAYLADLYSAGIRHFVVSDTAGIPAWPDANVLVVADTLLALQQLAAYHRSQFRYPVIGITGSNGKTIVKEWLYQLLHTDLQVVRSPKSYNSQTGVPLSVWQMQHEHQLAILEAGISKPDEMSRLAAVIRPDFGIFTNIGQAHREGFSSKVAKVIEKMRLFEGVQLLLCCADHTRIVEVAAEQQMPIFTWSLEGQPADVQVQIAAQTGTFTRIAIHFDPKTLATRAAALQLALPSTFANVQPAEVNRLEWSIPFSDAASVENAIHCFLAALLIGIEPSTLIERMWRLEPVEMRLELRAGIQGATLVNDFYNNDLASLRIALNYAARQGRTRNLTLILSDILESGQSEAALYAKVADALLAAGFKRMIGIGKAIEAIQAYLPKDFVVHLFPSTEAFMAVIHEYDFRDEVVLLKGARPFAFERIAHRLEQKAHKTILEINLSALVHNLNVYTSLLRPGVKTLVMVKAAAYGSGAAEVARLLEFHQVDYLGVAYADEGIELRKAGISLPILVLNPEPASFDAMHRFRLEPEVYSLEEIKALCAFAGTEKQMSIHVKLDTGMHRLGFEADDLPVLLSELLKYPNLRVQTIFSHLSASDTSEHDAFTHQQAATFEAMSAQLITGLGYAPLRHLSNTSGIVRFPAYHYDMVRLGIGLYGIGTPDIQERLRTVNTLRATVSQVKRVPAGQTVGYNRNSGLLSEDRVIATISIGYADGFLRLAGGGRYAVGIHGQRASTIGNICMDMCMIDVTHIPQVRAGDEVVIFGDAPTAQELAACLQTIPYEVLTNIADRVKRVYVQE